MNLKQAIERYKQATNPVVLMRLNGGGCQYMLAQPKQIMYLSELGHPYKYIFTENHFLVDVGDLYPVTISVEDMLAEDWDVKPFYGSHTNHVFPVTKERVLPPQRTLVCFNG